MGKFIVGVSGTDRKNEIISESYYVEDASEETKNACIAIYEEEWSCYEPHNISVSLIDVDNLYNNFKPSDSRRVRNVIYDQRRRAQEAEANERAMYDALKQKYEPVT